MTTVYQKVIPFAEGGTDWADIPGELPKVTIADDVDLRRLAVDTMARLPGLQESDFSDGAMWRDMLAFTNTTRTLYGSQTVAQAYSTLKSVKKPFDFALTAKPAVIKRLGPSISWIDIPFTFTTQADIKAFNSGVISVVPDATHASGWKAWLLRTQLTNYAGHGHPDHPAPAESGHPRHGSEPEPYDVLIIGAGHAGLSCAGRLKALGLSYLLVETTEQIGDVWINRYESLRWHSFKEYGGLPFARTHLEEDDNHLDSHMTKKSYQKWVEMFGIDVKLSTTVTHASWDEASYTWTITMKYGDKIETRTARNLVMACGAYASKPKSPTWPGRESFPGMVVHSAAFRNSKDWKGKRAVIVGAANSGLDIAEDMVRHGLESVTIVQRGATAIFPNIWMETGLKTQYYRSSDRDEADGNGLSMPYKVGHDMAQMMFRMKFTTEPELFDALERKGFRVDRDGDAYNHIYRRFGGHHVDHGVSEKILRDEIKVKNGLVEAWTEDGLLFEDGTTLGADIVVLATGYEHNFREQVRSIVGDEVDRMDDFMGMDAEGEPRGYFKRAGHPALYFAGGDIRNCRYLSRFVALQVQANILGIDKEPYLKTPG